MFQRGPPKLVISTKKQFTEEIKSKLSDLVSEKTRAASVIKEESTNGRVTISLTVNSHPTILTDKFLEFLEWFYKKREKLRGFGHVKYVTLAMSSIQAIAQVEHETEKKGSKLIAARAARGYYEIIVLHPSEKERYTYRLKRNCLIMEKRIDLSLTSFIR